MAELKRNRLKTRYLTEIVPALMKERGYKNIMEVPKLEKIVLNMRLGDIKDNSKSIQTAIAELEAIAGQKAIVTKAKSPLLTLSLEKVSLSALKLRSEATKCTNFSISSYPLLSPV